MLAPVDDARLRRNHVEQTVVEVRQQHAGIVSADGRVGLPPRLHPVAEPSEVPQREEDDVRILLEHAREDLAPALPRELRRLLERRVGRHVDILQRARVLLWIEHQALHAALLREPRDDRHVLRVVGPCPVVRPVEPALSVGRRHPEEEEALREMRLRHDLPENRNLSA